MPADTDNRPTGGILQLYENGYWLLIAPDGHYRSSPELEKHLHYVARTAAGQEERLSPAEFAKRHGWNNDPSKARLLKLAP